MQFLRSKMQKLPLARTGNSIAGAYEFSRGFSESALRLAGLDMIRVPRRASFQ